MKKAFQFRIYPNKNQDVALNRTLSTCRRLYNDSIAERKKQSELNELKESWVKGRVHSPFLQVGELSEERLVYVRGENQNG